MGKTVLEYPFYMSTMKKTLLILLAALVIGGEVHASAFREIIDVVGSNKPLNVTDQQILEALPVYAARAATLDSLCMKEMECFLYNRGLSQHQQKLILNWIRNRADVNTHPYEVWLLGCLLFDGYAGQINKQEAINIHRANARLGCRLSVNWLRYRGLAF